MPDRKIAAQMNEVGFEIHLPGHPEIFRALDKHAPRQNDFSKTAVTAAMQLGHAFGLPKSLVVGGTLDPSQLARINAFIPAQVTTSAFVLTKQQLVRHVCDSANVPTAFVFSSRENPHSLESYRMLSMSLGKHSDKYGAKILQQAYDDCKRIEKSDIRFGDSGFVIEEKFGKTSLLKKDENSVKERARFFAKGGLDWHNAGDDRAYFEPGWGMASFYVRAKNDPADVGKRVKVHVADFADTTGGLSILSLKSSIESLIKWIDTLRKANNMPDISTVFYTIPSVPVCGWISDQLDRHLGRSLQHRASSLIWGWHPAGDFIEFLTHDGPGTALLVDMEHFPRVTATICHGVAREN